MLFDLKDKVIVLTGATGALGGALALSLAKSGPQLIMLRRKQELFEKIRSE